MWLCIINILSNRRIPSLEVIPQLLEWWWSVHFNRSALDKSRWNHQSQKLHHYHVGTRMFPPCPNFWNICSRLASARTSWNVQNWSWRKREAAWRSWQTEWAGAEIRSISCAPSWCRKGPPNRTWSWTKMPWRDKYAHVNTHIWCLGALQCEIQHSFAVYSSSWPRRPFTPVLSG